MPDNYSIAAKIIIKGMTEHQLDKDLKETKQPKPKLYVGDS